MTKGIKKKARRPWALRLGHKLFSVAPYRTTLIVASSLASQIGLLLAFLLPLKIVMLLGAEGVPSYMPPPFDTLTHDNLIIVLSVLALTFYVTHLLANRVTEHASTAGAKKLLETSRKIVLFENQDTLAAMAYRKYAEALSGLTFSAMALGVLGWLYDEVAIIILLFAGTAAAAAAIAVKASHELRDKLALNAPIYVNAATGVGFLAVFVFIVADFLVFSPPNFLVAIIAIILGRQLLTQAGLTVRNIALLDRKKQKISALFFHDIQLEHQPQDTTSDVWQLLEENQRDAWLGELLGHDTDQPLTPPFDVKWVQTNVRNVIAIQVTSPGKPRTFVIKAFGRNKEAAALHEATLLLEQLDGLPSPPLVRVDTYRGYHCHVFDVSGLDASDDGNTTELSRGLAKQLLHIRPSDDIIERYTRSKKMLWDRLDSTVFARLRLVARQSERHRLDRLESALPTIRECLRQLPLTIDAPLPPGNGLTYVNDHGVPMLAHWATWMVVPQGAGWPVKRDKDLETLSQACIEATQRTNTSASPDPAVEQRLAACLHAALAEFEKQRYRDALDILAFADDSIAQIHPDR